MVVEKQREKKGEFVLYFCGVIRSKSLRLSAVRRRESAGERLDRGCFCTPPLKKTQPESYSIAPCEVSKSGSILVTHLRPIIISDCFWVYAWRSSENKVFFAISTVTSISTFSTSTNQCSFFSFQGHSF